MDVWRETGGSDWALRFASSRGCEKFMSLVV